jgi:methionyl-tRNA synthetase
MISNNNYIRTSSPHHHYTAQKLWQSIAANGDLYKGAYCGWYCVREERYVSDFDAESANFMDEVSGEQLVKMEEEVK